jgi:hypothetical protein
MGGAARTMFDAATGRTPAVLRDVLAVQIGLYTDTEVFEKKMSTGAMNEIRFDLLAHEHRARVRRSRPWCPRAAPYPRGGPHNSRIFEPCRWLPRLSVKPRLKNIRTHYYKIKQKSLAKIQKACAQRYRLVVLVVVIVLLPLIVVILLLLLLLFIVRVVRG